MIMERDESIACDARNSIYAVMIAKGGKPGTIRLFVPMSWFPTYDLFHNT
jgi:hypothetical protein